MESCWLSSLLPSNLVVKYCILEHSTLVLIRSDQSAHHIKPLHQYDCPKRLFPIVFVVCLHGPISTFNSFQNPQIPRTISSGHDVIHTPASPPVWGVLRQWWLPYPSPHERKTAPNHYALSQETRTVQSPTKLNDKI